MTTLKEFIKENSPADLPAKKKAAAKKKKRRLRLKNLNPFRKRKYKTLEEDVDGQAERKAPARSCLVDSTAERERRTGPWGSGGEAAGDSEPAAGGGRPGKRVTFRTPWGDHAGDKQQGSTECLLTGALADDDSEPPSSTAGRGDGDRPGAGGPSAPSRSDPCSARRPGASEGEGGAGPWDAIEALDDDDDDGTAVQGETRTSPVQAKKKKSAKKKLKKAGIGTAKMLGYGFSSLAVSFQYLTPDAMVTPVAKEISKRREDRYREVSFMAYIAVGT